jgi:glycosyltransferase involved in cell wall biosynthesis
MKPLRIGLILQADNNWMGGILYIKNLIKVISEQRLENYEFKFFIIGSPKLDLQEIEDIRSLTTKICLENGLKSSLFRKILFEACKFIPLKFSYIEQVVKREKLDFLYPVTGNIDLSWNYSCSWAAWIPDFQHKYLPDFFTQREIRSRDYSNSKLSQKADKIVFSSKVALKDFKKFYPNSMSKTYTLQFRTIPINEWYEGNPTSIQQKYLLPDNFFLVCNQFWAHKNHKILIEALIILKEKNIYPFIVCTGKMSDYRFPEYSNELLALISNNNLEEQFKILGLIPREDQIQLMRKSLAVIQPSLFEGWSSVVEDARLLGKNLILSDLDVHFEQDPPHATFFTRNSSQDLSTKIQELLPYLIPGPNLSLEKESKKLNNLQAHTFAKQFLNIILD